MSIKAVLSYNHQIARLHELFMNRKMRFIQKRKGLENKVVFSSLMGNSYSDNPRAISEKLHELSDSVEIVWLFKEPERIKNEIPHYIRAVRNTSELAAKELATAKVWVDNCEKRTWLYKSPNQMYIQTWHGDRAFKRIQYDNPFIPKSFFRIESKPGFCDLCVAGSDYGVRKFRSSFKFTGDILKIGTPRNDRLVSLNRSEIESIRTKLQIPENTKVLMYAPTIRKNEKGEMKDKGIDIKRTLHVLEEKDQCKWICFVRAHPGMHEAMNTFGNKEIIDVSSYGDMADLLLITDMLITDYSSCAGDYALLHKRLVLFQADRNEYEKNERTFYFDIRKSPYFIAESQEELEHIILSFTAENVIKNCDSILDFYGTLESGKASTAVAERIINWITK